MEHHPLAARAYPREDGRIAFLLQRDGIEATVRWVENVVTIYRRAVLNKHHFASTPYYRYRFIGAYCDFKRWLGSVRREQAARVLSSSTGAPGANEAQRQRARERQHAQNDEHRVPGKP